LRTAWRQSYWDNEKKKSKVRTCIYI
jgi:hypothetical protein